MAAENETLNSVFFCMLLCAPPQGLFAWMTGEKVERGEQVSYKNEVRYVTCDFILMYIV